MNYSTLILKKLKYKNSAKNYIFGVAVITVFSFYFLQFKNNSPTIGKCNNRAEYIHVKLGEHVFEVPWTSNLWNGEKLIDTYHACYQSGNIPIKVTTFSISPRAKDNRSGTLVRKYAPSDMQDKTREGFSLIVSAFLADNNRPYKEEDLFKQAIESELKKANKKLHSLTKDNNFYILNTQRFQRYYIAEEKDFLTPSSNPVTFMCQTSTDAGMNCGTKIFWKDNIIFSFGYVSNTYVPPSRLKEFYYDFLNYMESLEVPTSDLIQNP